MPGQALITIGDSRWLSYVAATYAELTTGLKGLSAMPAGSGMLFVLPGDQPLSITTRGLYFPIDIIFISGQLEVVEVVRGVAPGLLLSQNTPVRYFLEVNAGEAEGINTGDTTSIVLLQAAGSAADWIAPLITFAGVMMTGAMMAKMGKIISDGVITRKEPVTPKKPSAVIWEKPQRPQPQRELEFLPDSPEFLAFTIDDIGCRDKIDNAFREAIARAKRG